MRNAFKVIGCVAVICCYLSVPVLAQKPEIVVQTGNPGVKSAIFSPDAKLLVSLGENETIKLWEAATGRELRRFSGSSAFFSPDSKLLMIGSEDETIKVWEVAAGRELRSFPGGLVALSRDGKVLVSRTDDKTVKLWDMATGRELRAIPSAPSLGGVAFSPDGKFLLTKIDEKTIKLWEVASGRELLTLAEPSQLRSQVVFSPDGKLLACASHNSAANQNGVVKLWDTAAGRELRVLSTHSLYVVSISFSPDGKFILCEGSQGGDAPYNHVSTLWEVATGRELYTLTGARASISPDGKVIANAFFPNRKGVEENEFFIKLWDLATGRELRAIPRSFFGYGSLRSLSFSARGNSLVCQQLSNPDRYTTVFRLADGQARKYQTSLNSNFHLSPDEKIAAGVYKDKFRFWEVEANRELRSFQGGSDTVDSVVFSPNGKALVYRTGAAGHYKFLGDISLWDMSANSLQREVGSGLSLQEIAINPDGIVTGGSWHPYGVDLLEATTGRKLRTLPGKGDEDHNYSRSVAFSRDGKTLATGGEDHPIQLWETASGRLLRAFPEDSKDSLVLVFSPDGKHLVDEASVWEVATGRELRKLPTDPAEVAAVALSPDGSVIAVGSEDEIALLEFSSGRKLRTLTGHSDSVNSVAFSPNGKIVASGSDDRTIKLWEVATGRELITLSGHTAAVASVVFSADGRMLASGGDRAIRLWDVTAKKLLVTYFPLDGGDWAVIDPEGRFDASPGGFKYLHYRVGLTTIALEELKERYYEPGLMAKLLGFNREPLRNVIAFNEVKLAPEAKIQLAAPDSSQLRIDLQSRGGGIGRVQVFVNDSLLVEDARQGQTANPAALQASLSVDLSKAANLKPGEANRVRVVTWNTENFVSSPGAEIEWKAPGAVETDEPVLYAIVGGVASYSGDQRMNLRFSALDARSIAQALKLSAARLLTANRVRITLLASAAPPSASAGAAGIRELEPTKANFKLAFEEVAKQAKPKDLLVIFLAGHGVSLGINNSEYCYLTKEARSLDKNVLADPEILKVNTITSNELKEWVTKIPANKRVLILDTCEAGAASTDLTMARNLPGDQIRALDRLKDRTGFFVLMGAAANKASYETSSYGQGLLTYSLLKGIKGAALRDEKFVDVSRLFSYAQDEVPRLAQVSGGAQQPHFMAKEGATFDIGMLLPADQQQIKLAQSKPLLLPPVLTNTAEGFDNLDLGRALLEALREASANREINAVFVNTTDLPGALRPSGTYQQVGNAVRVRLVLIKDGAKVGEILGEGVKNDPAGLVKQLVERMKPVIDGLLPQ